MIKRFLNFYLPLWLITVLVFTSLLVLSFDRHFVPRVGATLETYTINDDAAQLENSNVVDLTGATEVFGALSTNNDFVFYRITNVTIPNASIVQHAYLKVWISSASSSGGITAMVKGEDADNSAVATTSVSSLSARTLTTASKTLTVSDLDARYLYWDVTTIVQEIVDRAGWASGNAMAFMFSGPSGSNHNTFDMNEGTNDPGFGVIYAGSADSARPPSVSGTGDYTNPGNATSSNNSYATLDNDQTGQQIWESFNIADLTGATITGILVQVEAKCSADGTRITYNVELSWDAGTTWTTALKNDQYATGDTTHQYGGAAQWSHTFIPSELTNDNFKVRLNNDFAGSTVDASVDYISVQVFYTAAVGGAPPTPGAFNNTNGVVRILNARVYIKQ